MGVGPQKINHVGAVSRSTKTEQEAPHGQQFAGQVAHRKGCTQRGFPKAENVAW